MEALKMDELYNTSLPTLEVEKEKCGKDYPQIGHGCEAVIYRYNEEIALKDFKFITDKKKLMRKFEKIELLGKLHDPSACFPTGIFGYTNKKKEGYFLDLVPYFPKCKDFEALQFLKDTKKLIEYIIQADQAIQRFHKVGIILGDIKENNIMIDENGFVKFVDTDNWNYDGYDFDIEPCRASWLKNTFQKDFSPLDNDRFVFAMMAIQYFVDGSVIRLHKSDVYFKTMIELMNVSQEVKDGLRLIFSDAFNKPYIGSILTKIDPNQKILTRENIYRLNRIF